MRHVNDAEKTGPSAGCGCGCRTGRILARSSYFMRSLFNSGLGFIDLLAADPGIADSDGARYVRHVSENVKALYSLFEELMDMSRVEAGVEKAQLDQADAGVLFSMLQERVQPFGIRLAVDCPTGVSLQADGVRLARSLVRLMTSLAVEGVTDFRVSVSRAEGHMVDLSLTGAAHADSARVVGAGATLEPALNLELFRGWVELMGGWVHQATLRPQAFDMGFSLRSPVNEETE